MNSMLFAPTQLSGLPLKNRIVMAPLTRSRAIGNIPNELMALYYRQRADAGLIHHRRHLALAQWSGLLTHSRAV